MSFRTLPVFCLCAALAATSTASAEVKITFDDLPVGYKDAGFLAPYGIPSVTWGGASGARGPYVGDYTGAPVLLPSGTRALHQGWVTADAGQSHWLTFEFSPPLRSFSLTRIGATGGGSTDQWEARFYNAAGTRLGSFGEYRYINPQPLQYTFTAPEDTEITRMVLDSRWTGFATYRNIPVDDFVLVQIPEPATLMLLVMGLLAVRPARIARFA